MTRSPLAHDKPLPPIIQQQGRCSGLKSKKMLRRNAGRGSRVAAAGRRVMHVQLALAVQAAQGCFAGDREKGLPPRH